MGHDMRCTATPALAVTAIRAWSAGARYQYLIAGRPSAEHHPATAKDRPAVIGVPGLARNKDTSCADDTLTDDDLVVATRSPWRHHAAAAGHEQQGPQGRCGVLTRRRPGETGLIRGRRSDHRAGRHRRSSGPRRPRDAGQVIVEFALILPVFLVLLLSVVEFAFVFNAILSVNFAARNGALLAAEAGNAVGADCIILRGIEGDVTAPADSSRISQVEIYRATPTGAVYPGSSPTLYTRTGTTTCTYPDRPPITVPYALSAGANGYPASIRCNVLKGCPVDAKGLSHSGVDHVGVRISYNHPYKTAIRNLFTGPSLDFDRANSMRMEPIL